MPSFWGVAGRPVAHSLTPSLFSIVGESLGLSSVSKVSIEASDASEFFQKTDEIAGDLWISCTSPLKHSLFDSLKMIGDDSTESLNQVVRRGGKWSVANTDGTGFIDACKYLGIEPKESVLRIKGGGSTARSIASAWAAEGGFLIPVEGRRELSSGHWDDSIVSDSREADLSIDLDAPAGSGESSSLSSRTQVSVSYGESPSIEDFSIIMLVAQHLEAWKVLFAPQRSYDLPSIKSVLETLSKLI